MDGNKDDALKCLRIGEAALESGDKGRALKFLSKARRLDPSLPIDELLTAARGGEFQDKSSSSNGVKPPDAPPAEEPGNKSSGFASTASSSSMSAGTRVLSNGSARGCTQEQIAIVREIKKQKDFYKILGLERNCTIEDVRKAYRKISLKVHPDKNSAPGSDEAFKAVSKAFQCLGNEESRKRYDLVGSEEPNYGDGRRAARNNYHGFNGFYEADFDADEIFRNFFFGGGGPMQTTPFGTFHFRTGGMGRHTANEMHGGGGGGGGGFNLRTLIQILPVLLLLLLNFLPSSEPVYSLSQTYQHDYKVETPRGVPYYVKRDKFDKDYPYQSSERVALERRIEREYIGILSQNCRVELQRRRWGLSHETPYCDMLRKFD